jgi:hypothetical protein
MSWGDVQSRGAGDSRNYGRSRAMGIRRPPAPDLSMPRCLGGNDHRGKPNGAGAVNDEGCGEDAGPCGNDWKPRRARAPARNR